MSTVRKIGWTMFAKAGIVAAVVLTYTYHTHVKKLDYNLFEKKAAVEQFYYSNPAILDIEWKPNNNGNMETYLVNQETGKQVEVMYDMLPKNSTMAETITERLESGYTEEGFDYQALEEIVDQYKKIEKEKNPALFHRMKNYFKPKEDAK